MDDKALGLVAALVLIAVFCIGWLMGSQTIAHECTKLNGFYVGNTVYECQPKNTKTH